MKVSNDKKLLSISGAVVSMSHIFRLSTPIFILKVYNSVETFNVIINKETQLKWQSKIYPGLSVELSNLKKNRLSLKNNKYSVYLTSNKSALRVLNEDGKSDFFKYIESARNNMSTYKGTVTSVAEKAKGIFTLNGTVRLVLSYLMDVTTDLWYTDVTEDSRESMNCIAVGDVLSIYNCHFIKEDGVLVVVCCGKSLVNSQSNKKHIMHRIKSHSCYLHFLHEYNLTFSKYKEFCLLFDKILKDFFYIEGRNSLEKCKDRAKVNEALTDICDHMMRHKGIDLQERSLVNEFIGDDHDCVPLNGLELNVPTCFIEDIKELALTSESTLIWNAEQQTPKEMSFIVAHLKTSDDGYLQLVGTKAVGLVVLNKTNALFSMLNGLILVTNYTVIEEIFRIRETSTEVKRYIRVCESDMKQIYQPPTLNGSLLAAVKLDINILENSAVLFSGQGTRPVFFSKVFIYRRDDERKELLTTCLLRFDVHFIPYYPFLDEGCVLKASLPAKYLPLLFKTKSFQTNFDSSALGGSLKGYVEAPVMLNIVDIKWNPRKPAVTTIGNLNWLAKDLVSVEGHILRRCLMTSKFSTEQNRLRPGIPGSKVLRLLVRDAKDGNSIWIYLSPRLPPFVPAYTLGLLEGTLVTFNYMKVNFSTGHSLYLSNTLRTSANILNTGIAKEVSSFEFKYLNSVPAMASGLAFTTISTVSIVIAVKLYQQCGGCRTEKSNKLCPYVGCHFQGEAILAGEAKLVIDDGTGVTTVLIKDSDSVKCLLSLSASGWAGINAYLNDQSDPLVYSKGNYCSDIQQAFSVMVASRVLAPFKFACRKFSNSSQTHSNKIDLFCITLAKLNPNCDYKYFDRSHR